MELRNKVRPVLATTIIVSWLFVELLYGSQAIDRPTLELRLMLVAALIWMFGESVDDAVDIIRGNNRNDNK